MKTLYSWLKEFSPDLPPFEKLGPILSSLGFSIDSVEKIGLDADKVVVGEILKIDKHPNADRLSLCEVSIGSEIKTVVCGAKNIAVGQKIPLALVGARLHEGILKKAKIRGIESDGMICSAGELGLSGYDNSGILVLDGNLQPGTDLKTVFDEPDYVFELEITPNLAYCLSHYALARELSLFRGFSLRQPTQSPIAIKGGSDFSIEIENPSDCYRYYGLILKGIKNKNTPKWLYQRLKKIGINPKGDILIDASNYVMYEIGQPTHCFDLRNIEGGKISVRRAREGEIIKTLDAQERRLDPSILVITDAVKPIAIAGVMGGYYSSVLTDTEDVLIESAHFNPSVIRKSSKAIGLKSDSSFRFERGIDFELQEKAALRVAQLIIDLNPQAQVILAGDVRPYKPVFKPLKVDAERINLILGCEFSQQQIDTAIKAVNPHFEGKDFIAPTWRFDIKTVYDLAEEIARYYGYDSIKSQTRMLAHAFSENPYYEAIKAVGQILNSVGLYETVNYDLISLKDLTGLHFSQQDAIELKNPLSADFRYLRPSLICGILKNLRYNINRGAESVMIYENGKIFSLNSGSIKEKGACAGLMFGKLRQQYWRFGQEYVDFYHIKGVVERLFDGVPGFSFKKNLNVPAYFKADICLEILAYGKHCGYVAAIDPLCLSLYDIKESEVYAFEFDLETYAKSFEGDFYARIKKVSPVSCYQHSLRDLSILVDKRYCWEEIKKQAENVEDLLWVKLIDVYQGKNIPSGTRSLTMRFMFSSMEKTFTDKELNAKIEQVYSRLNKTFGATLRI